MSAEAQSIPQPQETPEKWDWKNDETVVFFARLLAIGTMLTAVYLSGKPYEGENKSNSSSRSSQPVSGEYVPGGRLHIVAPGETLFGICEQYGVSIDRVLAANAIENANVIYADQELIIPPAT